MSDTNDKMVSVYPNQESEIWLRSKNGIIAGVCQGVADRLVVHPWLIRGLWLASVLFFGAGLVLHFLLPWPSSDRTVTRAELQTHPTR